LRREAPQPSPLRKSLGKHDVTDKPAATSDGTMSLPFPALMRTLAPLIDPFRLSPRPQDKGPTTGLETLGRLGPLEVRLARSADEIRAAQALRYQVFYREMGAVADDRTRRIGLDCDRFDALCDHLLVLDHGVRPDTSGPRVVGTCRLLGQETADANGGFYTAGEFDLAPLLSRHRDRRFLELGRSCVLPTHRTKRTVELLWLGIWAHVLYHRFDVMFGCASLEGTDPDLLALPLSFLHHAAPPTEEWRLAALADRRVEMNRLPAESIDPKAALRALPALIKGYVRLGAMVGDGAVVDRQFGTTDVAIVLPVSAIAPRYLAYYGADAGSLRGTCA
jgi:L-ornithine Nalpha-acyltransferase